MGTELQQAKQAFIDRLPDYQPPAVRMIRTLARRTRLPGFVVVLVVCALPYLLGLLVAMTEPDGVREFTVFWLRLNVFMITAGAFILLDFVTRKTVEASEMAVRPLEDVADIPRFEAALHFLFLGRAQYVFLAAFAVPSMVTLLVLLGLPFSGLLWLYWALYAFFVATLAASGLWAAFGLIRLSRVYASLRSVRFNLIEPLNTVGVRQMAEVSTTWGICFAVEAAFLLAGLWLAPWNASRASVFVASSFWTAFILVMTVLTFIYPKTLIRPLVLKGKQRGLNWFQEQFQDCEDRVGEIQLTELFRRKHALDLLKEYNELQVRIAKARVSPLDVQTMMKLAGSILVPGGVFLSQHPEVLDKVGAWILRVLP